MAFTGLLQVGIELGEDAILVRPKRQIGSFVAQVTIEEEHHDSLEVTDHPVEKGATITDHAFKRPAELTVLAGWSNSPSSNAAGSSSSVLGSLAGAVTGTIGGVVDLANQASQSLGKVNPFDGVSDAVAQLSDTVTGPLAQAGEFVQGALNQAADGVVSTVAGGVSDALGGIGSDLIGSAADVAGAFTGSLDSLASSLGGANVGQVVSTYQNFIDLQRSCIPFDVYTGKRFYQNMLIAGMTVKTDKTTENALFIRFHMREIIIVANVVEKSVSSDQSAQSDPEDTAPTVDQGDAQLSEGTQYNQDAGNESIEADAPEGFA
jgi:hypothetical protein